MAEPAPPAWQRPAGCDIVLFHRWGRRRSCAIGALVAPIRAGKYDFVIGSRVRGEREPGSMAGISAGRVARGLADVVALRRSLHRHVRLPRDQSRGAVRARHARTTYGWNIEMQMRAARAGLRILELPVAYRCRTGGNPKWPVLWAAPSRAGWRIIATFARVAME